MTSDEAPTLHALVVEPSAARPGDVVCATFRTRNVGTLPSPPGAVIFALPHGLEPLDPVEVPLPGVAPDEIAEATLRARVLPALDDCRELLLQAQLRLPDLRATTNACALHLRSRVVLGGDASGTFVEPIDADTVRVRAVVCNEGDAVARDVRVQLSVPAGCRRLDGDETLEIERLTPGDAIELAFTARVEQPTGVIRADRAWVRYGSGASSALAVRGQVPLEPRLVAPLVDVRSDRRRIDVAVTLGNEGWSCAQDVSVRVIVPPGLHLIGPSVAVDGAAVARRARRAGARTIGHLQHRDGAHDIAVGIVPARGTARITFAATHDGNVEPGVLEVRCGEHTVELTLRPERHDDVRVDVLAHPPSLGPGDVATLRARVINAGDGIERLRVALDAAHVHQSAPLERTLEPGTFALVELPLAIPDDARTGERIPFALIVSDAHDERARTDLLITVASPPPVASGDDEDVRDAPQPPAPVVHAVLAAAGEGVIGAALAVRLVVDAEDAVDRLIVRVANPPGSYVAASTKAGECAVLDRNGRAPLEDGLVLRAIAAGTRVTIGWSVLVTGGCGDALTVAAALELDGTLQAVEPIVVALRDAHPFAFRPAELPYHVDAPILAAPARAVRDDANDANDANAAFDDGADALAEARGPSRRWDDVARLMHGTRCDGLIRHLLALRAVFPDADPESIDAATIARDAAGEAARGLFDRLFVKLRIPNFVPGAEDVEDRALRRALLNAADARGDDARSAVLFDAPLGGPAALRGLLALVPEAHGSSLERAQSAYLAALDGSLAEYEGLPLEVFEAALARGRDDALDAARAAFVEALDYELAARAVGC